MLDWQKILLFIVRSCNKKKSNLGGAKINCHHPVVISRNFFSAQAPESANVVFSVFALTPTNGATVTLAMMIGCGMVEKLLRRNICLSGLCTLVTLAIHWIEKRGDTALAHLNVTETYSLTTWSHLGIIFFPRQIAMFNSRFHDFHLK